GGIVHLLAPDLAVLKSKGKDMGFYNMRLQAFHKDLFYETVRWKAGLGPPVLLDADDKKLPKHACLRLVVPNIVRIALAKLPVVEVLEERPAKRRALGEGKKDLWEVVDEGSTAAPSAEEVTEPTEPEPIEQPEVWAATVSQRTVLFEHVRNVNWGLINLQDTDSVDAWHKNPALPRIMVRLEEGEIYVSGAFLQAHCKKLSLEVSPRSQRERPLPAKAEDAKPAEDVEMADAQPADDKQPAEDVEMPDAKPEEAEDRPQVERLVYSGEVVWVAAKDSRTVFFQEVRRRTSPGQPAPDLSVKLINPERDEEFVSAWCKACFPKISVSGFLGEDFSWDPEIVHAYCWELSWDSLFGRHAKQAKPAKPAEAEDEAEPAPVADAKPAVAEDKPPEQAEDEAEPPAPEEGEDDQPAAVAEPPAPETDVETLHGLKVRKIEGDWYALAARTLDDFEEALKILTPRLKDKTFAEYKMKRGEKGWTTELFEVRWDTGKLWMPKGRRSVLPEEAKAKVRLSA
ncbi:unnamed protein product, partial [Symbiodinium sp. KB8]